MAVCLLNQTLIDEIFLFHTFLRDINERGFRLIATGEDFTSFICDLKCLLIMQLILENCLLINFVLISSCWEFNVIMVSMVIQREFRIYLGLFNFLNWDLQVLDIFCNSESLKFFECEVLQGGSMTGAKRWYCT